MIPSLGRSNDPANSHGASIRQRTGDGVQFGGVRVSVHERSLEGTAEDSGGGRDRFWLFYCSAKGKPGWVATEVNGPGSNRRSLFVAPGVRHPATRDGHEELIAHFDFQPAFLEAAAMSLRLDPRTLYRAEAQELTLDEPLETLCRLLASEAEQGCPHGLAFFEALSWALAVALVRRVAPARAARPRDSRVERAVRLLEERFRERVSVAEAARAAGLSRCHFLRAFRANVGLSPHEYLVQCRLRHARRLIALDGGRRSLTEIAIEAGFSDQAHLTRHFRRAFGQTPGQWQRSQ
jgi:AraC-like DNA-binding protein